MPNRARAAATTRPHGTGLSLPGILDCVVSGARGRREAIRQLADLRRRLKAAEGVLILQQ